MDNEKLTFTLKKKNEKKNFSDVQDIFLLDNDKNYNSKLSNENNVEKKTSITSFSLNDLTQIKTDIKKENDYIIECKNPLKEKTNHIEILLNKQKEKSIKNLSDDTIHYSIPIEKFGLAMLKGMGYDPEIHKTKPKIYKKKNYSQSGLGADIEITDLSDKNNEG